MPQFFIKKELTEGRTVEIRGSDAHHIKDVLRLTPGDWLVLSDGRGNSFMCTLTDLKTRQVSARVDRRILRPEGTTPPTIAIAMIRSERLEWAVQKCVELGARHIIPFNSARTVRKSSAADGGRRIKRLRKIAEEAAKQSGLPLMPAIDPPKEFEEVCARLPEYDPAILLFEGERKDDLKSVWGKRMSGRRGKLPKAPLVIIGPEGGFTPREVEMFKSNGAVTASLGLQILRVETAAVAVMTICQYELGNLGAS